MLGNKKRYATLRSDYHHIMEQKYDDAIADYQIYLDVDSKIYWTFVEMVNDKFYSLDVVNEAINLFQKEILYQNFGLFRLCSGLFPPNSGHLPDLRLIE